MNLLYWMMQFFKPPRLSVDEEILEKKLKVITPVKLTVGITAAPRLLTTAEMVKYYGKPGDPDNITVINTPYPLRIAWDLSDTTTRIGVHKKVAAPLLAVMNELLQTYGLFRIQELGIDLFGGLFNFRPQRGLEKKYARAIAAKNFSLAQTYLSRHSWATAIDLDPARNTLKETSRTARFARPAYKDMISIFYKHGFISYGIERNNDWMHFEYGLTS